MKLKNIGLLYLFIAITYLAKANTIKVNDQTSLNAAIKVAVPGDTILMATGDWKNTKLVFENNGTATSPIVINAEVPGKTRLTGNSSLKFAGNYLVIKCCH